jgi:hypothetical protein
LLLDVLAHSKTNFFLKNDHENQNKIKLLSYRSV